MNIFNKEKYYKEYNKKPEVIEKRKQIQKKYDCKHKKEKSKSNRVWRKNNPSYQKEYYKKYPEKFLESKKKQLKTNSKLFNMKSTEYDYAKNCWSKSVKKRDNYECQICGSNVNINAHHILYKQFYPQLSLNLSNGVTLCKKCHEDTHGFKIY